MHWKLSDCEVFIHVSFPSKIRPNSVPSCHHPKMVMGWWWSKCLNDSLLNLSNVSSFTNGKVRMLYLLDKKKISLWNTCVRYKKISKLSIGQSPSGTKVVTQSMPKLLRHLLNTKSWNGCDNQGYYSFFLNFIFKITIYSLQ